MPTPELVQTVMRAQQLNAPKIMPLPNVVGTGVGFRRQKGEFTDETVLQVFVTHKYPVSHLPDWAIVPREVLGPEGEPVPVDIIEVGYVYAAADSARYRPVRGGSCIGHQNSVDRSTLGGWACDLADDTIVQLTCNHCIANLNTASVPGGIVQPGRYCGGVVPNDLIGDLKRFIPITTGTSCVGLPISPVDAAIGTINVEYTADVIDIGPAIYELGAPTLGMAVQKRGRTTEYTNNGTITSVGVDVCVGYGGGVVGRIGNAFIVTSTDGNAFADRGDSGSVIFDQSPGELDGTFPAVGMFFAVSNGGVTTWHNDINVVFEQLELTTLCNCVARAIIEAIFGPSDDHPADGSWRRRVDRKVRQLKRLRAHVLRRTAFGKIAQEMFLPGTAQLSHVLIHDDEAFGLAVKTLAPWVRRSTIYDALVAKLDARTVENLSMFAGRVSEIDPKLGERMQALQASVAAAEGMPIRDILEIGKLG